MRRRLVLVVLIAVILAVPLLGTREAFSGDRTKIRFGALPVLQALPLYVAQEKGLFAKASVEVEIIPFNAAAERDIALSARSVDGYFGDLIASMVLIGNGLDIRVVATNYDSRKDRRMIAVLGKPGCKYHSVADLADVPVALSSNSVIDFVTEQLLTSGGVPQKRVASLEAKNIGLRMQMLLSGQVEAAALPEPLATAAIAKGAVLLADDSGLAPSQTVLGFTGSFIKKHPETVKAFLRVINEANRITNTDPDSVRAVMVEYCRLPESLKRDYPVPRFPVLHAPDKESVETVAAWLKKRGVINTSLKYGQVVDAGFLP
ncbi:MAG: ABC transporter substrate-binding protein [Desulfomonilaceae bacterium]